MKNTMNRVPFYKQILGLFVEGQRHKILQAVQSNHDFRIAMDSEFCDQISLLKLHSEIGRVFKGNHGKNILEIGCGPGRYAAMFAKLGLKVTAIDPFQFDTWDKLSRTLNIEFHSDVYAEHLPHDDNSFDNISCLGALLYFDDPEKALTEMHRILKKDGTLILRTVNLNNNYTKNTGRKLDPSSKNLYTKEALEILVKNNGFKILESYTFGYWPSRFTNLFWYIYNCFLSSNFKEKVGKLLPEENRVLITIVAVKA